MMITLIIAALAVPWASGTAASRLLHGRSMPTTLSLAVGWLLGQIGVMVLTFLMLVATGASRAPLVLVLSALIGAILWWRIRIAASRPRTGDPVDDGPSGNETAVPSGASRWLWHSAMLVIGASLLGKLLLVSGGAAYVSFRNDDAVSLWLYKAKVIATLDRLPLDVSHDYHLGGSDPAYPVFAPLIAGWVPLVTGRWHEHYAILPWLGFYVSLPLLLAGGLSRWLTARESWICAYLAASSPLIVIHAYRPGYVDLLLAAFIAAALLYVLTWQASGRTGHLALMLIFTGAVACMKREGPPLAAVILIATAAGSLVQARRLSWRRRARIAATVGLLALVVRAVVDLSVVLENVRAIGYHPEVIPALVRHAFSWDSFHFLFWILAAAAAVVLCRARGPHRLTALLLVMGLLGLDVCVFLLTPQARFALNDQTPSRLFLQVMPGAILVLAVPLAGSIPRGLQNKR